MVQCLKVTCHASQDFPTRLCRAAHPNDRAAHGGSQSHWRHLHRLSSLEQRLRFGDAAQGKSWRSCRRSCEGCCNLPTAFLEPGIRADELDVILSRIKLAQLLGRGEGEGGISVAMSTTQQDFSRGLPYLAGEP